MRMRGGVRRFQNGGANMMGAPTGGGFVLGSFPNGGGGGANAAALAAMAQRFQGQPTLTGPAAVSALAQQQGMSPQAMQQFLQSQVNNPAGQAPPPGAAPASPMAAAGIGGVPSGVQPSALSAPGPQGGVAPPTAPFATPVSGPGMQGMSPAGIQAAVQANRMRSMGPGAPGTASMGPLSAGAPGAAAPAAPGLNPAAIQQALAARMQRQGAMPTPVSMGPGGGPNTLAGLTGGGPGIGFKKGGKVKAKGGEIPKEDKPKKVSAPQWGNDPDAMAKGGSVSKKKRGFAAGAAEELPPVKARAAKAPVVRRPPAPPADEAPPPVPSGDGPPPDGGVPVPGMKKGGKWIQSAIKKPGALHKDLGVPKGEKIPEKKLAKAAKKSGKVGERARMAETLKKMRKAKGGVCKDCGKEHDGDCKMATGGKVPKFDSAANMPRRKKFAAGGAAKERKGFPNTIKPPKKYAEGGRARGCGIAQRGCRFSGIY